MTNMTNIVPWLRSGTGQTPTDGGCIMQVIDWIHRNEWTDNPPCVHPVLRRLAIAANDQLDDAGRQRLLALAPRLMGTASDDRELSVRLAASAATADGAIFDLLLAVLDEHDRITGRTTEPEINWTPVCEVMAPA